MIDLSAKTNQQIDAWIENHERLGQTTAELYRLLIEERNRRHGKGLTISKSISALVAAARQRRFMSYGELADANGMPWTQARHRMNGKHGHLDDILAYCHARGIPLLTAIVVQKGNLETGAMDQFTLDGFVEGVQRVGVSVVGSQAFLRECQNKCFDWAQTADVSEFI